jgi:predicted phage-related endonuclease
LKLGLTLEQLEARRDAIGGSDAAYLMSGDHANITRLWLEKSRKKDYEDLSDNLAVQMGSFTEPLNVFWFEKQTGFHVKHRGLEVQHEEYPFIRATLDGVAELENQEAVFEAKHVNPFNFDLGTIIERYYPQVQHQMMCCGLELAVLSVLVGTFDWHYEIIPRDILYQDMLLQREKDFWECVTSGFPPKFSSIFPDLPQKAATEVADMSDNDAWAYAASDFLFTLDAAKQHKKSIEKIKEIFPKNYCIAMGNGVKAKRSSNGTVRVTASSTNCNYVRD